jgi:hypothetical protein
MLIVNDDHVRIMMFLIYDSCFLMHRECLCMQVGSEKKKIVENGEH